MSSEAPPTRPIRFVVHSDYLCPWCANAAVRWRYLEDELGDRIAVEWRSYLLRPVPRPAPETEDERLRIHEKFARYARSWERPAAEEDAYPFRPWSGEHDPPTHSVPAHRLAKAARALGDEAFRAVHDGLFRAYFQEGRDVSCEVALAAVWERAGLPAEALALAWAVETEQAVRAEHRDAVAAGVTGVPSVQLVGNDAVVLGAQPVPLLRRWVERIEAGLVARDGG